MHQKSNSSSYDKKRWICLIFIAANGLFKNVWLKNTIYDKIEQLLYHTL